MRSRDSETGRLLRVCAWAILSILLAVMSVWLVADGALHVVMAGGALLMAAATAADSPFISPYMNANGHTFFALASMVVALIVGTMVFGWWGIAFSVGALVTYLLAARIAVR